MVAENAFFLDMDGAATLEVSSRPSDALKACLESIRFLFSAGVRPSTPFSSDMFKPVSVPVNAFLRNKDYSKTKEVTCLH